MTGGYSIVEILIYVALFATLSIAVINSFIVVVSSFNSTRVNRNLLEAGSTIMERISREIRQSYAIDVSGSTLGTSPGVLDMDTTSTGGGNTTVKFIVENGLLNMYDGSSIVGSLNSPSISIQSIIFRKISTAESDAVKIELTLQDTTSKTLRSENFYNTIILRETY